MRLRYNTCPKISRSNGPSLSGKASKYLQSGSNNVKSRIATYITVTVLNKYKRRISPFRFCLKGAPAVMKISKEVTIKCLSDCTLFHFSVYYIATPNQQTYYTQVTSCVTKFYF